MAGGARAGPARPTPDPRKERHGRGSVIASTAAPRRRARQAAAGDTAHTSRARPEADERRRFAEHQRRSPGRRPDGAPDRRCAGAPRTPRPHGVDTDGGDSQATIASGRPRGRRTAAGRASVRAATRTASSRGGATRAAVRERVRAPPRHGAGGTGPHGEELRGARNARRDVDRRRACGGAVAHVGRDPDDGEQSEFPSADRTSPRRRPRDRPRPPRDTSIRSRPPAAGAIGLGEGSPRRAAPSVRNGAGRFLRLGRVRDAATRPALGVNDGTPALAS